MKISKLMLLIIAALVKCLFIFCGLVFFISWLLPHPMKKDAIFNIVNNKQELLSQAIVNGGEDPEGKFSALGVKTIWFRYPDEYCEFACGNDWDVYSGFYYSAGDMPYGWEGENTVFQEDGKNRWVYRDDDHHYYYETERIRENWFYFYAKI